MTADEPVMVDPAGFVVAWDRDERHPCERNTPGCSVNHTASPDFDRCETW